MERTLDSSNFNRRQFLKTTALGAPVAGLAIDQWGWGGGFVSVSLVGVLVAVVGAGATRTYRHSRGRAATRQVQVAEPVGCSPRP